MASASLAAPGAVVKKSSAVKTVKVEIIEGLEMYVGKSFVLEPKPDASCLIGRSTGKKFRDRGISLPMDGEVTMKHGKFKLKAGKAYYVDLGSTNGTFAGGKDLKKNVPLELRDGLEMHIGAETLKITLEF